MALSPSGGRGADERWLDWSSMVHSIAWEKQQLRRAPRQPLAHAAGAAGNNVPCELSTRAVQSGV